MSVRFAFAGFRHPHIFDMYGRCRERDDIQVVASCEEHAATRDELAADGQVDVSHHNRLCTPTAGPSVRIDLKSFNMR